MAYRCKDCSLILFDRKAMRKHIKEYHGIKSEKHLHRKRQALNQFGVTDDNGGYVSPITESMERVERDQKTKEWVVI